MSTFPRLLTELVGTFLFLVAISLSGAAGPLAPLAIGGALMAMVYMGGHVSGAHYNPAVTLAVLLRRRIDLAHAVLYWVVQLVAAVAAFWFGHLVGAPAGGIHPGTHVLAWSAVAVETAFTAMLALTVLNVAATRATAGNSYYGLAIGLVVMAGAFTAGPISGGAFNPAVAFGATVVSAAVGGGGFGDLWIYLVGPLAGAVLGAAVHRLQAHAEEPVGHPA